MGETKTYTALEGENWREWIDSNINSMDDDEIKQALELILDFSNDEQIGFYSSAGMAGAYLRNSNDETQRYSQTISDGETYHIDGSGLDYLN